MRESQMSEIKTLNSLLYETTPKRHGFLMIRRVAWMTRIKQRTAEYRITNIEFRRMESLSHRGVGLMPYGPEAEA
jgi:hypothetical protein